MEVKKNSKIAEHLFLLNHLNEFQLNCPIIHFKEIPQRINIHCHQAVDQKCSVSGFYEVIYQYVAVGLFAHFYCCCSLFFMFKRIVAYIASTVNKNIMYL